MKKIIAWLSFLSLTKRIATLSMTFLAIALLIVLFTNLPSDSPDSSSVVLQTQGNAQQTEQSVYGMWYAEAALTVLELKEDGSLAYYSIQPGYYNYYSEKSTSFTLNGNEVAFTLDSKENKLTFDGTAATLTSGDGAVFTRVGALPSPHPTYDFPLYSEMDCTSAVTLGTYKGLKPDENASLHAALAIFEEYYGANKDKTPVAITEDRAAAYGDVVVIDYSGKLNGEVFQGGTAEQQQITISENSGYIDGFVEGVIGHKMGETFDVNVTFPKDYGSADLAGKAVVFTMTLHTIYDLSISDPDIKAYTKDVYQTYADILADYTTQQKLSDVWAQIQESTKYDAMPLEFYQYFLQYYHDVYHSYAFSYGMEYSDFAQYMGINDEVLKQNAISTALPYVISQAIFTIENLEWNEADYQESLDDFIADAMEYFKYTEEQAREFVLKEEANNLKASVIYQAVNDWLLENNP